MTKRMWKTMVAIKTAHLDTPFDVLHGFWADQGGVVTGAVSRRKSIANIVTVMAGELTFEPFTGYGKRKRPIAGRLARFGARQADALITHSRYHADRIAMEQAAMESLVTPFGVDTERFSPNGRAQALYGRIPVLCAASLVPVKCHKILLQAFELASSRVDGLHLHLVGEGVLELELRRQVKELGMSDSVTFHGHVEHDVLPAYYRGASFCVLGSCFEGHGMVILEAAACGRLTIGCDVGSMREFCPADYLSNIGDSPEFAHNIQRIAADTDLRMRLAEKAHNKVNDEYTMDVAVNALEDIYIDCRDQV